MSRKAKPSAEEQDYYNIPLIGQVRFDHDHPSLHKYSIGELIENFRRRNSGSVTLRAMDNGLIFTGILPGDYLTVDLRIRPSNGDIVALKLGGRLFVRKIYFDGRFLRMESDPERPAPFIIEQNAPGFELIGKVVNIVRELL